MDNVVMDNVALAKRSCSHLGKSVSQRQLSDYQPFFGSLADDVVLESASPDGSDVTHGKQAVVDHITDWFSTLAQPELEEDVQLERPLEYFADGDRVVTLWRECTRNKMTGVIGNSKEVAVVMDFRGGLIVRIRRFSQ